MEVSYENEGKTNTNPITQNISINQIMYSYKQILNG